MVEPHVYRKDGYIAQLIRRKARLLSGRSSFSVSDREDIEHDLWLHLLERQEQFDPARASFETFANRVINNKVRSIIRHSRAARRCIEREMFSLQDRVEGSEEEGTVPRSDAVADPSSPAPDRRDLSQDFDAVAEQLDPQARRVLELCRCGHSQNRVAEVMRISRRQVSNAMGRIRKVASASGLEAYFAQKRVDGAEHRVDQR